MKGGITEQLVACSMGRFRAKSHPLIGRTSPRTDKDGYRMMPLKEKMMSNTRIKRQLCGRRWTPRRRQDRTRWVTRSGSSSKGIDETFKLEAVGMKSLTWVKEPISPTILRHRDSQRYGIISGNPCVRAERPSKTSQSSTRRRTLPSVVALVLSSDTRYNVLLDPDNDIEIPIWSRLQAVNCYLQV